MVENTFERDGKTSCERRYYICSALLLATIFASAVRCHWHIESRLPLIRHLKNSSSPLALINQADSLGLRITDHHQRGAECWHRVRWVSSMRQKVQAPA